MADLLRIRARNGNGITWEFVDESYQGVRVELDQPPIATIKEGDVWQVELVSAPRMPKGSRKKTAIVRLIAKIQSIKPWQHIKELPEFWIQPNDLAKILCWLHEGTDLILIGPKGSGKTTFPYVLAEHMGWQEPCKVDVATIKRTTDLFGSDAAQEGSTMFRRSALLDYIERSRIALENGLETQFLVILDEINRVHAKANESMHGLFDDTRQISVTTTEGTKTIKLPPNIHFIGTMNMGANYLGTHELDEALKDRFQPIKLKPMPEDAEVRRLVDEIHILEAQALAITQVANKLRGAANAGIISYSPSYRSCRNVARLVKNGFTLRQAVVEGFFGWYQGDLNEKGEPIDPNSETAKALSALKITGVAAPGAKGSVA